MLKKFFQQCLVRAWVIWLIAAIFYAYEFFIRISPAVMVDELMRSFSVNAALLGSLSAFYYYAYASMQIPVGILLDRYGIRHLLTFAAITVTIGSFMFASTQSLWLADLGRILMGVGSAFSFVGCLKLANNWFPARHLAVIIGLTNMLGVLGAVSAEAPLSLLVSQFGWRYTLICVGIVGAILALLIRMIVRDEPAQIGCEETNNKNEAKTHHFLDGLFYVLKCRRTWLAAIYGGLMVAPISAFTELWSVPFFETVDHLKSTEAALVSSIVFIGIAIGGPLNGWLSGYYQRRKPFMLIGNLGALICLSYVLFMPHIPGFLLVALLFLFGFFTSSMLLVFAINTECNPDWVAGVAIGFTNMVVMLGGTIFQPLVGWLLDINVGKHLLGKYLVFNVHAFHHALFVLPLCQVVALALLFIIGETYCGRCK